MSLYVPPDIEMYLTTWLRDRLPDAEIGNKTPTDLRTPLRKPVITISDATGSKSSIATFRRTLTVLVRDGTRLSDQSANDLSRIVFAWLTSADIVDAQDSPIAAVIEDSCFGPYPAADDLDVAARIMTVEYSVVGTTM